MEVGEHGRARLPVAEVVLHAVGVYIGGGVVVEGVGGFEDGEEVEGAADDGCACEGVDGWGVVGEFEEVSGSFAVGVFVAVCFVDDDEVGVPLCEGLGEGGGVFCAEEAVGEDEDAFFWGCGFFLVGGGVGLCGFGCGWFRFSSWW